MIICHKTKKSSNITQKSILNDFYTLYFTNSTCFLNHKYSFSNTNFCDIQHKQMSFDLQKNYFIVFDCSP